MESRVLLSCVPETEDNNALALANVLTLGNDPSGSGLWGACATGEVSPAVSGDIWSDPDYWRFDALAGDRVAVRIDTPASDLDPYVELRNAADGVLASDNNGGPVNDALVSRYQIQTSGSYFVRVGKSSSSSVAGVYELHLQIGRGIELESDAGYANDSIGSADPLTLAGEGGGTSLFFDGQDDLVVVGDTPNLRLNGPLTFEAWVYPTDVGSDEPVLVEEGPGGRLSYWFGVQWGIFPWVSTTFEVAHFLAIWVA